jgi:hypothetical protein
VGADGGIRFPADAGGTLRTPGGVSIALPAGTSVESAGVVHIPAGGAGATVSYADGGTRFVPAGSTIRIADPDTPLASALVIAWDNPFGDVAESDRFYADVVYVCERGLMNGTSALRFDPQTPMTRGMLVTVLGRFADADVTRQDLATLLARCAEFPGRSLPASREAPDFEDGEQVADYARDALRTLAAAGVINGKPGKRFDPNGTATRAEVAAVLHRFLEAAGD